MACNYTPYTWSILILMIVTGSARSVFVKLSYQSGFEAPLTISCLYLLGQTMSLILYFFSKDRQRDIAEAEEKKKEKEGKKAAGDDDTVLDEELEEKLMEKIRSAAEELAEEEEVEGPPTKPGKAKKRGSKTGLTEESYKATEWVNDIPWYVKPIIPGFFNFLNATLRWFSLIYIAASISEMLISGLELAFSVMAARIVRKRFVSTARWTGVGIVIVGILLIGYVNYYISAIKNATEDDVEDIEYTSMSDDPNAATIGNLLVFGQCVLSVLQDIAEEVFMQAAGFSPLLLLGMEGLFGVIFGTYLFLMFGKHLGEDPVETMKLLENNPQFYGWMIGLPFLFLITGIYNIKATEVTSSMTRNVWKNFRNLVIWIVDLLIFYIGSNADLGEEWMNPESFYILYGFCIIFVGVVIYYSDSAKK